MALAPEQIRRLLGFLVETHENEIDCDRCLEYLAEFAELNLSGRDIPDALEIIDRHLRACADCSEEFRLLRQALADIGSDTSMPD